MAVNEHFRRGDFVSLPVPAGTRSGAPLRIGGLNAVAVTDRAVTAGVTPTNPDGTVNAAYNTGGGNADGSASCWLSGAHDFTVAFAATTGDPIYLTPGGSLSATASGNTQYGNALNTKAAASGVLVVRITN